MLHLEFLWKDPDSIAGDSPALYRAEGGYVVQGYKLDKEARSQLRELGENEDAVYVPSPVLDRLRDGP